MTQWSRRLSFVVRKLCGWSCVYAVSQFFKFFYLKFFLEEFFVLKRIPLAVAQEESNYCGGTTQHHEAI